MSLRILVDRLLLCAVALALALLVNCRCGLLLWCNKHLCALGASLGSDFLLL